MKQLMVIIVSILIITGRNCSAMDETHENNIQLVELNSHPLEPITDNTLCCKNLYAAVSNECIKCINQLLKKIATNSNDKNDEIPMNAAIYFVICFKNNYLPAKALLEHGANINIVNHYGNNYLHMASQSSNLELLKFLLGEELQKIDVIKRYWKRECAAIFFLCMKRIDPNNRRVPQCVKHYIIDLLVTSKRTALNFIMVNTLNLEGHKPVYYATDEEIKKLLTLYSNEK